MRKIIKAIPPQATWPIRHRVMWPNEPFDYIKLPADETGTHFGLWLNLCFMTIDELFEGDYAENAKRRARKMGTFLYLKIFEARNS